MTRSHLPQQADHDVENFVTEMRERTLYAEVEIEYFAWDDDLCAFTYSCPCGDLFRITPAQLSDGEKIAKCSSCLYVVRVIFNPEEE